MHLASGGDPSQIAYRRYVSRLTLAECRDRLQSATLGQPWEAIIRSPTPDVPTRISLDERRFVLVSRARDLQRFGIKVDGILSAVPRGTIIDLRLSSTAMTSVIKTTAIGLISLFALFALVGHLVSGVGLGLISCLAAPLQWNTGNRTVPGGPQRGRSCKAVRDRFLRTGP